MVLIPVNPFANAPRFGDSDSFRFNWYFQGVQGAAMVAASMGTFDQMLGRIVGTRQFTALQNPRASLDRAEVMMRNAWFTEEQLCQAARVGGEELVCFANHWAPVQAYYCLYLAWRCYITVSGDTVEETHRGTLNHIGQVLHSPRQALFLPPWNANLTGNPETPASLVPSPNPMTDAVLEALKSTRKKRLDEKIEEFKEKQRRPDGSPYQRVPPAAKVQIVQALDRAPTTFFDFLYRLRLLSNYETADLYLLGMSTPRRAAAYNESLRVIVNGVLLNLEVLIAKRIGLRTYQEWETNFRRMLGRQPSGTRLHERTPAIVTAIRSA